MTLTSFKTHFTNQEVSAAWQPGALAVTLHGGLAIGGIGSNSPGGLATGGVGSNGGCGLPQPGR